MFKTTTKYNSLLYYPLKPVNIHTYILGHLPIQIQNSISVNVTVGVRRPLGGNWMDGEAGSRRSVTVCRRAWLSAHCPGSLS